jgi:hypothetical protein
MVHDLEWEGDDGHENLWGLYYKFPDVQFIQLFKSLSTTKECVVLDEVIMKGQGGHTFHRSHPISDDATTVATTYSSSMTSLIPGTTNSTSTDALI